MEHAELSDLVGVLFVHPQFLISILFFVFAIFMFLFIGAVIGATPKGEEENPYWRKFKAGSVKIVFSVLFLLVIATPYTFIQSKISNIQESLLPVYEITLNKNNLKIGCAVGIGSTTNNLFYWDIVKKQSIIIPKKQVVQIRVLLSDPPVRDKNDPPAPPGHLSDFDKLVIDWNKRINGVCGKYS